ncbi:UDP-glycosyltransferase 71K1-like [Asparagus officinalis]|uniref:UDP-glycosyltransferase 71K1-like n=1 Tax=Asparagus officinalis TaxID=4686 RepID=UPI00098E3309|nr:UDP-glycosyltransferase 71K1-like [Asparagus officinalis]
MAKIHLVFIPAWPAGHIASMLQFATKLLQTSNNLTITTLLIRSPSRPFSSTDADSPEDFLSLYLQSHRPHLKHFVSSSSTPVSAIFIDLFATALLDVANELRIPSYVYFTSTALMLALMLHLPALEEKITGEFEDVEGGIPLPGVEAIPGSSMPSPFMRKESKAYTWFVYHGRRYREAKGIVVNTFEELESRALRLLGEGLFIPDCSTPKVFPVGPVLATGEGDEGGLSKHECVRWLDQQPPGSVVFLCFGSMGCFDAAQVSNRSQCFADYCMCCRKFILAIFRMDKRLINPLG